jgi:hypothetical protein
MNGIQGFDAPFGCLQNTMPSVPVRSPKIVLFGFAHVREQPSTQSYWHCLASLRLLRAAPICLQSLVSCISPKAVVAYHLAIKFEYEC